MHADASRLVGAGRLIAWLTGVAIVWLVALPLLARWEPVARHGRRCEAFGVDPAALFYTELKSTE